MAKGAAKPLSKSDVVNEIVRATNCAKKDVKNVVDGLIQLAYRELKKKGIFTLHGLTKAVVVKKPATKAREGINPFTGEKIMIKAKPARKAVRFRAVKAAKDAVA